MLVTPVPSAFFSDEMRLPSRMPTLQLVVGLSTHCDLQLGPEIVGTAISLRNTAGAWRSKSPWLGSGTQDGHATPPIPGPLYRITIIIHSQQVLDPRRNVNELILCNGRGPAGQADRLLFGKLWQALTLFHQGPGAAAQAPGHASHLDPLQTTPILVAHLRRGNQTYSGLPPLSPQPKLFLGDSHHDHQSRQRALTSRHGKGF